MDERGVTTFIIHLKGIPRSHCDGSAIRKFLQEVQIPPGAVHCVGEKCGQALIELHSLDEAVKALRYDGHVIDHHRIHVQLSDAATRARLLYTVRDEAGRPGDGAPSVIVETRVKEEGGAEALKYEHCTNEDLKSFISHYSQSLEKMSPNEPTSDDFDSDFSISQLRKAPLLPIPSSNPFSIGSHQMPSSLLPLNHGGYWVKCINVCSNWTDHHFDQLLKKVIKIKQEYFIDLMPENRAYVNFVDYKDYLTFLKRLGHLEDEDTPKLDVSYLLGMNGSPCAEYVYSLEKIAEQKKQQVYNGPVESERGRGRGLNRFNGGDRRGNAFPSGHFRGRGNSAGFRNGDSRPGLQHERGRPLFKQQRGRPGFQRGRRNFHSDAGPFVRMDQISSVRMEDQVSSEEKFRPENSAEDSSVANDRRENTRKPPKKRFRGEKRVLAPNDLAFRIRGRSNEFTGNRSNDYETGSTGFETGSTGFETGSTDFEANRSNDFATNRPNDSEIKKEPGTQDEWETDSHSGFTNRSNKFRINRSSGFVFNRSNEFKANRSNEFSEFKANRSAEFAIKEDPRVHNERGRNFRGKKRRRHKGKGDDPTGKEALENGLIVQLRNLPGLLTKAEIFAAVQRAMGRPMIADISSAPAIDSTEAMITFKHLIDAERAERDLNGYRYKERHLAAVRLRGKWSDQIRI